MELNTNPNPSRNSLGESIIRLRFGLAISIIVLFVLSALGLALMLTTTTEKSIAINYRWGEQAFFNGINKELIQKIICQKIIYYSVSLEDTNSHRLYDEAVRKTVYTPLEVNALVLYQDPEQKVDQFTIDTIYRVEVYFYQEELRERKLIPRVGDFVKFGNKTYELETLTQPQIVYGQIEREVMVKAIGRIARESQFKVLDDIPGV